MMSFDIWIDVYSVYFGHALFGLEVRKHNTDNYRILQMYNVTVYMLNDFVLQMALERMTVNKAVERLSKSWDDDKWAMFHSH